jgi:DNA topoisomerase-2
LKWIKIIGFSTKFTVEGVDPNNQKSFSQTWTNNMRNTDKPIVKNKKGKGYTKVCWIPDFQHFGIKNYTNDIIGLYTRHIIDAAMISKVKIYLNDRIIPVKNLSQYAQLYDTPSEEKIYIKTDVAEVLVTPSSSFQVISFVNGVYTRLGGQHVDAWSEAIFRPIVDKFNGKDKKTKSKTPKINITDVKQFFRLFVVSTVVRPEFDGQDKNKLESPQVPAQIKTTQINSICKWSVMDNIEDIIRSKEMLVLKKAEKGKKKNVKVDGLDPANNAGGKYSSDCSLFVCEGLSAKTYVVAGIDTGVYGKRGRDWFGVLPVTGKVLNVRNATATSIAANKVIVSFIQTTGLKHGVDYTVDENFKTLSYGKVIIVADADVDGIHIEGLIMNLIHSLFPSLLERKEPYLIGMKTPIARVFIPKKEDLLFYDENNFNKYLSQQTKKVNAKYYKGLGTTREEDVPDTFGLKMIEYITDIHSNTNMNKVFHKKYADARKTWLEEYSPQEQTFSLDNQGNISQMTISNFLNGEMIKFSHADCSRSIPNGIDGMKESQRKILYAVKKRNLKYSGNSLKVAQLSGYTAEHSNYHHGEQNLQDTIINMASGFPGTNNIPLLYPDGGFGTRLEGGKDAASARYIFTKMEGMTEYIFRAEDEPLLTPVNDDGDLVQPEYYIPIIPMILVNGCSAGIGTGWSCNIPCYNPVDLIESIKIWIENDGEVILEDPDNGEISSLLPDIKPWYRDFKGEIYLLDYGLINSKNNVKI